jgi:hypothetical protein
MAIAYVDQPAVPWGASSGTSTLASASFTPAVGDVLVVNVGAWTAASPNITVGNTGFTATWTQEIAFLTDSNQQLSGIYTGVVTASASGTVTITRNNATIANASVTRWTGVDTTDPSVQVKGAGLSSGTSLGVTLDSALTSGSALAGSAYDGGETDNVASPPTSWTANTFGTFGGDALYTARWATPSGLTHTWTGLAGSFYKSVAVVELRPAAGAAAPLPPRSMRV